MAWPPPYTYLVMAFGFPTPARKQFVVACKQCSRDVLAGVEAFPFASVVVTFALCAANSAVTGRLRCTWAFLISLWQDRREHERRTLCYALAWIIHEQTLILKKAAKLGALARGGI